MRPAGRDHPSPTFPIPNPDPFPIMSKLAPKIPDGSSINSYPARLAARHGSDPSPAYQAGVYQELLYNAVLLLDSARMTLRGPDGARLALRIDDYFEHFTDGEEGGE